MLPSTLTPQPHALVIPASAVIAVLPHVIKAIVPILTTSLRDLPAVLMAYGLER